MRCFLLVPLERCSLTFLAFFNFTNIGNYIILIIAVVLLIVMAYFLSLSETAYTTVNIVKLRNYMEAKRKGAKKAVYIAEKFDLTLTSLMISRYIVNIAAVAITTYIFSNIITGNVFSLIISGVIMLIFFVIFGDIIPKAYAKEHAEQTALNISGLLYIIIKIQFPITWIFMKLKKILIKKDTSYESYVTEDELESIIDVMEYEGVIEKDNAELLQSAMNLSEITVYDIMTPRVDIVAVDVNDEIEDIKNIFFENKFSRIPVYDGSIDNITGYVNSKDLFKKPQSIKSKLIKIDFVPETMLAHQLLTSFIKEQHSMAVVVDEFGGTAGLVTIEDIIEEIIGEIDDEHDQFDFIEKQLSDNQYLLSGRLEVGYLNEKYRLNISESEEYDTLAGFIINKYQSIPKPQEVIDIDNFRIKVAKMDRNRIDLLHLTILPKE